MNEHIRKPFQDTTIDTDSDKLVVSNYQALLNAKRPLWKRFVYFLFKTFQPDIDFIKILGLSPSEEKILGLSLKNYTPLHFSLTQKGVYEKQDIVRFLLQKVRDTEGGRFLLLAESGCGKTTILYKLFCEYAKKHKNHHIIIREFRKGHSDVLHMKIDDQKQTILLLDGLDEDLETIRHPKQTFEALADTLKNFKCVVLSARLQLFKDHNDEPTKISQFTEFEHLYLDILSNEDTEIFLRQKFNVKKGFRERFNKEGKDKVNTALLLIQRNAQFDILRRPFLLQFIDWFLPENVTKNGKQSAKINQNTPKFGFEYQIYQMLIQKWLERESEIIVERVQKKTNTENEKTYRQRLFTFSQSLAGKFFSHEQDFIEIDTAQYENWLSELWDKGTQDKETDKALAQTHSLLSRDLKGHFSFAHRSIFDYFLAEAVFECEIEEEDFRKQKNKYALSFDFYNQMCWHKLSHLNKSVAQELDDDADCLEFIASVSFGSIYTDLFKTYIQPYKWMSVRAFLIENRNILKELQGSLATNDTLFVVLGEVIYRKLGKDPMALRQLLNCAEKLLILNQTSLSKQEASEGSIHGVLHKSIQSLMNNKTDSQYYRFIHPLIEQYCYMARFTGVAIKSPHQYSETVISPKRTFIPPLSMFFELENKWLTEKSFFDRIAFWKDDTSPKNILTDVAFYALREHKWLYLQNTTLSSSDLQCLLSFFNQASLDLRQNNLTQLPLKDELPQDALFKMKLEGNPFTDNQKAIMLDILRPYLHISTIMDFEKTFDRGLYPSLVAIQGGTFTMGDSQDEDNLEHEVTVDSFKMGQFPITLRQFKVFIDASGYKTVAEKKGDSYVLTGEDKGWSYVKGVTWACDELGNKRPEREWEHPVVHVSWFDAIAYCNWLSEKQGLKPVYSGDIEGLSDDIFINYEANGYRLPTEAEWEYAAGNGTKHTKYSWGNNDPFGKQSGNVRDETFKKEWYSLGEKFQRFNVTDYFEDFEDGYLLSSPVGSFNPNELGLYDMTGNVNEWCSDWYDKDYFQQSPLKNPRGPEIGEYRSLRGGSWVNNDNNCRVSYRSRLNSVNRSSDVGFRVVWVSQDK